MPPAKRVTEESTLPQSFLQVGQVTNVTVNGRTLFGYEILGWDANFVKFRGDLTVSPQTEVVLIPYGQIEAIGLVGIR